MDVADAAVSAQAGAARAQVAQEERAREGHARARGALQGALGKIQPRRTPFPTTRGRRSRTSSCSPAPIGGGNWQGVMFNRPLGPDDHERHERRAVGTSRGARSLDRARRRARRGAPPPAMLPALPAEPAAGGAAAGVVARPRRRTACRSCRENVTAPGVPNMNKVTPEGGRFWDAGNKYSCAAAAVGRAHRGQRQHRRHRVAHAARRVPGARPPRGSRPASRCSAAASRRRATWCSSARRSTAYFRAIDASNGNELWREKLDAPAHSIPSTLHRQATASSTSSCPRAAADSCEAQLRIR